MSTQPRIIPVGEEPPPLGPPKQRKPQTGGASVEKTREKAGTGARFKVVNTFADFTMRSLGRAEIAVWLLLWRDTKDGVARTSQKDLAQRAGVSERTARRAVQRLCRAGLLTIVHQGGVRRGPSTYRVDPFRKESA